MPDFDICAGDGDPRLEAFFAWPIIIEEAEEVGATTAHSLFAFLQRVHGDDSVRSHRI